MDSHLHGSRGRLIWPRGHVVEEAAVDHCQEGAMGARIAVAKMALE